MTVVSFNEYLQYEGVQESIDAVRAHGTGASTGKLMEECIKEILLSSKILSTKETSPEVDYGFGADFECSYNDKGFFLDCTLNDKKFVKYLNKKGELVDNINSSFCMHIKDLEFRFGVKERHYSFFFYEKPVVVLNVKFIYPTGESKFAKLTEQDASNIMSALISINELLIRKGYSSEADMRIKLNKNIYK